MRKTLRMLMMMVMVVALALPLFAGGEQEGAAVADKPVVLKVAHVGAPISPQQGAADLFVKLV
ncbi:MAG: hypothetical protein PHR90_10280, partial [Sphaerochaetaceae bacterium]|nr:hypothetical protein [Sphaerochaetaceae bacterium]